MVGFFSKTGQRGRCYFCHQAGVSEACYSNICIRHQALISLRLFILLARSGRFSKLWRIVKWEI